MADNSSSNQNQKQTSSSQTQSTAQQNNVQNQNTNTNTQQQQQEQSQKSTWLLGMPGLRQKTEAAISEMQGYNAPQYQLANLTPEQQQALQTLYAGRNKDQMKQILGQYQQQAGQFTNYGQQQTDINNLAKGYYQGDLVNQNKAALQKDINDQLAGQVNTLNQGAVGSGNMASSRAGVAQGVMTGKAQEAYAKGAADIENSARESAYNMAYQQYQQGQSNLFNSLGAQTNIAQTLANWDQADAQTAFNAGLQQQKQTQTQYDLDRQNAIQRQTNQLQGLTQYLPVLSTLANFGVNSQGSASGSSNETGKLTDTTTTSGSQTSNTSGNDELTSSGTATGGGVNWAQLGANIGGQAAGFALQPVVSQIGSSAAGWLTQHLFS